jgi:hypothetical protein
MKATRKEKDRKEVRPKERKNKIKSMLFNTGVHVFRMKAKFERCLVN